LKPTRKALKQLRRKHRKELTLHAVFTPAGGSPLAQNLPASLILKRR
jgi:hypothetical protein